MTIRCCRGIAQKILRGKITLTGVEREVRLAAKPKWLRQAELHGRGKHSRMNNDKGCKVRHISNTSPGNEDGAKNSMEIESTQSDRQQGKGGYSGELNSKDSKVDGFFRLFKTYLRREINTSGREKRGKGPNEQTMELEEVKHEQTDVNKELGSQDKQKQLSINARIINFNAPSSLIMGAEPRRRSSCNLKVCPHEKQVDKS